VGRLTAPAAMNRDVGQTPGVSPLASEKSQPLGADTAVGRERDHPTAAVGTALGRHWFHRQLLTGALALAMLVLATLVMTIEVHLDDEVELRYQEALSLARQQLDAHNLDSASAAVAQRALEASKSGRFLNLVARYTTGLAVLLAVSFGGMFGLLMWRSQSSSREAMNVLDRMAREDGLTGIANRRTLDEGLTIELARARRSGQELTVVMLDLDHFKRFNDRRGHGAGDALLRNAAQAWRRQLRPTDLLARYGGEEFTLVLPSCDADAACHLVERLRPLVPERQTFSAGVALWEQHESPEQLLARADHALLVAKKQGRNRTIVSGREPQMTLPLQTV
jgi:diguanylate cyclase (GGDEF)-like protein